MNASFALLFGLLALSANGVGGLAMRGACASTSTRTVAAECVVGLLIYPVMLAVAAEAGVPFAVVLPVSIGILLVGTVSSVVHVSTPEHRARRLAAAVLACGSMLLASLAPLNEGALDPKTYAYMTTVLFQPAWTTDYLIQFNDYVWLRQLVDEADLSRAASLGLLWPAVAIGWGMSARLVGAMAAWFLVAAWALTVDLLDGCANLPMRALIAVGAIGAFNEIAVLAGGQINQSFALAAMLSTLWTIQRVRSRAVQLAVMALACACVTAGYPEFLAAVPVYLVCTTIRHRSSRDLLGNLAAATSGWALIQVATRFDNLRFLLEQVNVAPGWWPLPDDPGDAVNVWRHIVLELGFPAPLLLVLVPVGWWAWRSTRYQNLAPMASSLVVIVSSVLAVLATGWSVLVLQAGNPNYATFKVGGWIGPALFIVAFGLIAGRRHVASRLVLVVLVLLAASRTLGLAWDGVRNARVYMTVQQPVTHWQRDSGVADQCVIHVSAGDRVTVMTAVAESDAPVLHCRLE